MLYLDASVTFTVDFKYYENPSDEFADNKGSLLPLWKFAYEKTKRMAVTCIQWYVSPYTCTSSDM